MKSISALILILAGLAPSMGSAQAVPREGDRVRITQADGSITVGEVITESEDVVWIDRSGAPDLGIPWDMVESFELSLGRPGYRKRLWLTAGAIGVVFGASSATNWVWASYGGYAVGALLGIPVGLAVAALTTEERWGPAQGAGAPAWDVSVQPVSGGGAAVRVSIPWSLR